MSATRAVPGWASELAHDGEDAYRVATAVRALATPWAGPHALGSVLAARVRRGLSTEPVEVLEALCAPRRLGDAPPSPARIEDVARTLLHCAAKIAIVGGPGYPSLLADGWPDAVPPAWLAVRGRPSRAPAIAVVGTRRATHDGLRVARELGRFLADHGVTVVSGLARGIDQAAHTGALDVGGRTTAVLGTGFGVDYPRRDEALREAVTASGGLYTEYPPGAPPRPAHFLERNRIVAGMTAAVVVVEGQARSGALHTARLAAELSRDVWAVPGSLSAPASRGPLDLIRDGAFCVTSLGDVLASIGLGELSRPADGRPLPPDEVEPTTSALSPTTATDQIGDSATRAVAELLGPQPTSIDALLAATGVSVARLLAVLADLERRGLARTSPRGVTRP